MSAEIYSIWLSEGDKRRGTSEEKREWVVIRRKTAHFGVCFVKVEPASC